MQAVLLLKQTLEKAYDPGPLLLDGPNAKFSKASQLFFKGRGSNERQFHVGIEVGNIRYVMYYNRGEKSGLQLVQMDQNGPNFSIKLTAQMTEEEIKSVLSSESLTRRLRVSTALFRDGLKAGDYSIIRDRCFLDIGVRGITGVLRNYEIAEAIGSIIHVPGLRGNPARDYPVSAVGAVFPGTFDNYTASVIAKWQNDKSKNLQFLGQYLEQLGLTWKVESRRVDDTKVELRVGRTTKPTRGGAGDMVSVADVGFGVSQTLPVVVALLVARPGQVVYLEQPEIHLHPRAQVAMAAILADAAKRGVRVIAETHSSLLLTGVQTLVANNELPPDQVKLHWFTRDEGGETHIQSANLDETGAFGDWPEDFDEVVLTTEGSYLDAVEARVNQQSRLL